MKKASEKLLTVAVCTYNRANNLPRLIDSLASQKCPIPYEILFVNNNSSDETKSVLEKYAKQGIIRYVTEQRQGISHARNRAIEESIHSDYLLFMDDDELPSSNRMLEAAVEGLSKGNVQCVGGRVKIVLGERRRPKWLTDELLGFYGENNYGDTPFLIRDFGTPIWTGIVAYDMDIFRKNPELRFDIRYNRQGNEVGGGEDAVMFRKMLNMGVRMMYLPDMAVDHHVEEWRISRRYFWKLHYMAGVRKGKYELKEYDNLLFSAPLFLYRQMLMQGVRFMYNMVVARKNYVRVGMNFFHAIGLINGYRRKKHSY